MDSYNIFSILDSEISSPPDNTIISNNDNQNMNQLNQDDIPNVNIITIKHKKKYIPSTITDSKQKKNIICKSIFKNENCVNHTSCKFVHNYDDFEPSNCIFNPCNKNTSCKYLHKNETKSQLCKRLNVFTHFLV
jgi:hypothetical protein